ncbi:Pentatricopeptide repeat (PPR) superfamily protein [Euphorbia peplus]|nr:Pentatricopeptide repeat (PPR) superfamily protein [Euphorbia peplus]
MATATSSSSLALHIKKLLLDGINSIKHLKNIHATLLRFNLNQDNYLLNIFLQQSFDLDDDPMIIYTRLVFNQTQQPNIFLWNTMIRGFVSQQLYPESIQFYISMRKNGFLPTNFTFPFILKSCVRLPDFTLGFMMHNVAVKCGFDVDLFVNTSLVTLYSKYGDVDSAFKVFDESSGRDVVSWNAIISGFIGIGRFREGIDMFVRVVEMGLNPDSRTFVEVLSACVRVGDLASGEMIERWVMRVGGERNLFVATSLVDLYAKFGYMEKARFVFDGMNERDIVSWSIVIQGYASNGMPREAVDMFFKMLNAGFRPDRYSMVGFLCACARLGALELGEWGSNLIDRDEFLANPVLGTSLIDMYAKCGSMTKAWEVFRGVKKKDRDRVVWNSAISGLAMNGHVKVAFGLFGQMEKSGVQPDGNTFVGLLCGCTHAGLVDEGRKFFNSMSSVYSFDPKIEHYGCMVDLLGRAGLLDEAYKLIKDMPMEANTIVWGALLSGCRLHRNTQLAEHAVRNLIRLEPWNSGNYVLLSNIYSTGHKWDDALSVRSIMTGKGIQKVPALSWIEVDGVVHEFLVNDKSHPLSNKIYAKLTELGNAIKSAGYLPMTDNVLFDIEEEEKEHVLGFHSEKLAIAFGLITTAPECIIRVVKNLRVCSDCHEAIKLISRITGRDIIVRDNNRFHYFSQGSCSCKDYW